ncbi:MAG: ATP-binding cassette domain-containing protein, partial [Actinobacteria bacterium]|nr:ATP-binding cassette domain-containing protein [Actinomycetota bacterium]
RRMQIVFQDPYSSLNPRMTIGQIVGEPIDVHGLARNGRESRERVAELLKVVGLNPLMARRYPHELSGGQRQRVGVARALAVDPPVLLMDEPFGAVDPIIRARLQDQFLEIQDRLRKTVVFVTHDIDEAIKMADRIAILNIGGVIEQYAPPEEILREPANAFVEEFVGAERGLKRLALLQVSEAELVAGPVVAPSATPDEARGVMKDSGYDWVTVVDGGRLLGWVDGAALDGVDAVGRASPRPFSATVTRGSSLRQALDAIVSQRTNVAVVVDGDRYVGMLTLERVSREIVA